LSKEYEDYSVTLGKIIKYWGELEGFNIVDVYNQKNYLLDPFEKSAKLGALSLLISKYFDENSVEFGVKFYEENQKYPHAASPYHPLPMAYDENLELNDARYTPTLHLAYNFVGNESQTKLILLHGYDNKRYFIPFDTGRLAQHAYRVNKALALSNVVYKESILKCEAAYTDVISDEKMSDYAQLSFGAENNFYNIGGLDIGLYSEYYRYIYMQNKIENVDISEIYNNDIFLAIKLNFNDVKSSEIKGGLLYDMQNEERVFKMEAKSRVSDGLVLSGEFLHLMPSEKTLFAQIGTQTRVLLGLTYTF
jgi:hypothetical protein